MCLSGCGSSKPSTPRPATSQSTSTATDNQSDISSTTEESESEEESGDSDTGTYKIGDTVKTDKWEITVKSITSTDKLSVGYGTYYPDEGDKYVLVELSAKNVSKESETFLPAYVSSKDIKATLMYEDYTFMASKPAGYDEDMLGISINPLSEKTGKIVFKMVSDVADKTSELNVVFTENNKTYIVTGE